VRYLLDTHVWVWSLLEPDRLPRRVVQALEKPGNELWLSPISVWELVMLVERGRIVLDGDVGAWVDEALQRAPLKEAPLTLEVALETHRVRLEHRDPADRFLVATARVFDLTLVTADARLIEVKDLSVLAAR